MSVDHGGHFGPAAVEFRMDGKFHRRNISAFDQCAVEVDGGDVFGFQCRAYRTAGIDGQRVIASFPGDAALHPLP